MRDIIESFKASFDAEPSKDLIYDVSDLAFDAFIDSTALNGIPIFGFLNSIRKIGDSIQDYRLARKLYNFVYYTSDISSAQRAEFMVEYQAINQENAYESLFAMIDRIDNVNKIAILSNLMRHKIWGRITIDEFIRLTIVLERIPYPDLFRIANYTVDYYESGVADMLYAAGILYQSVIDANSTSKYRLNSVGEQFLKFGLCEDIQLQDKYITSVNAAIEWHDIEKVTKD